MLLFALAACSGNSGRSAVQQAGESIVLYNNDTPQSWQLYVRNHEQDMPVKHSANVGNGMVKLDTVKTDDRGQALALDFQESWSSGLYFLGEGVNLQPFVANGILEFDMQVEAIDRGIVSVSANCTPYCHRHFRLREWAQENVGSGWHHLAIPVRCLVDPTADLSAVKRGFNLETGGNGKLKVANIAYRRSGTANVDCKSDEQLALTPAPLNEYWSTDWWMPRHEEKLAQAKEQDIEVVMLGDSITQGWENGGKTVWSSHFGDISTLNLGFGGDRTENVLWRLQHGALDNVSPELVVIMIGTNNTGHRLDSPQAISQGVAAIVDKVKKATPDAKVLLLAIFPRSAEAADELRQNNEQTNALLKQLAKEKGVMFDNFNKQFLTANGELTTTIMPDLLHPEEEGYEIWARQLEPYIDKYVRNDTSQ
ncbi:1,4-beta-D-glucan glucohydrolase [Alteromonas pelagimontana]|uniref:1,4-beta-D-glucan glucohydrolase n=1 Tax=Alteromonas pelagimontana TaxID=1858656 RepID=A0A6M4MGU8_9ALTE|nr:GDSL-type esterase/lipase family protein [Alteromonas pelagimontana]QJR82282.1 1,4-beta-D-glucan glucohydrolase [Alteromonas pelagimontana]